MLKEKVSNTKHRPVITIVPRRLSAIRQKINPLSTDKQYGLADSKNDIQSATVPTILSARKLTQAEGKHNPTDTSSNNVKSDSQNKRVSTSSNVRVSTSNETNVLRNMEDLKQSNSDSKRWFNRSTPKQKSFIKLMIVILIIAIIAAITIFLPVYFLVIRRPSSQSSFTNITISSCYATTCLGQETPYRTPMITVLYPFDGNANDISGYASGIALGSNSPSYTGYSYVGYQAITLSSSFQQYVMIPYVNLSEKSFTIETWIMSTSAAVTGDYGIFGQCDLNLNCLSISVRDSRFVVSFNSTKTNSNTLTGTTFITPNLWFHLTIAYDALLYQQQIYVNGLLDAISIRKILPHQGTLIGSTTTIGRSVSLTYGTTYFQGRIDHFTISAGVIRTTCQIYNDATLAVYFPFDTIDPFNDRSTNLYNSIASSSVTISTGRINQALYFTSSTSYFQSQCFPNSKLDDPPFTFSFWINPSSFSGGGTIIHMSNSLHGNGTLCFDLLALTNTGSVVAQWMLWSNAVEGIQGPVISANTWTHIVYIYSRPNSVRLYINGQLSVTAPSAGIINLRDFDAPFYITLGNISPLGSSASVNCNSAASFPIVSGSFIGAIDDFRIYSRELNPQEICVLANP